MKLLGLIFTLIAAQIALSAPANASSRDVYVIGDSITYWQNKSAYRPAGWTLEGYPGRRITALENDYIPPTTDYWQAVTHIFTPKPRHRVSTVVIGLGTNGADYDMTVAQAANIYRQGISRVRSQDIWRRGPKRVVLITPYKARSIEGGVYQSYQWSSKGAVYAAAIRQLAHSMSHVCVMPWRAYASKHPGILKDGIHSNAHGRKIWRNMAVKAVHDCR